MASRTLFRTLSWIAWDPGLPAPLGSPRSATIAGVRVHITASVPATLIGDSVSSGLLVDAPLTERYVGPALRGCHQGV